MLVPSKCACGEWTVLERSNVWTRWDAAIVEGDDLAVAIILGKQLCRLDDTLALVRLTEVWNTRGLKPDGRYLALHKCGCLPVGTHSWHSRKESLNVEPMDWPDVEPDPNSSDPWSGILKTTLF